MSNSIIYGDVIQVIGDGPVSGRRGRYFTAPRLGPSVVSRPGAIATVASALVDAAPSAVIALVGNGGLGKTTLAAAVCRHDAVAAHYAGGVLWVRLGQQRSGSALADAINAVSFEVTGKKPEITDPEQAGQHLGGVIAEDTLIVLDDVWSSEQISPFTLTSSATLLVTTRNITALPNGAAILRAEPMAADEAAAVLSQGLDAADPLLLAELAERCAGLPLLLALVGRAIERYVRLGASIAEAAAKAREQLRDEGAAAFDQTTDRASKHVAAMITSSLTFLEQEYGPETSRWYQELGIFPDGTDVPVSVLARYWSSAPSAAPLTAREAERLCLLFVQHSLFEEYSVSAGTIRLHDVALSYLRQRMRPDQLCGLNERLLRAHLAGPADDLVDADWAAAAGREGYLWRYLGYHMRLAGHQNDWAAVAADPRWVVAKLSASGPVALHADLEDVTSDDAALLRRAIVQSSHLLGEPLLRESLAATLLSRFPPTEQYRLLGAGIAENITGHWVQSVWPLPDRPPSQLRAVLAPADPRRVHPMANYASGPWVSPDTDRFGLPKTQVVVADSAGRRVSSLGIAGRSWFVDVWDIVEGRLLETRDDFLGAAEPNVFTVAGQRVAVAHGGTVRLWDAESQTAGPTLVLPSGQWSSVAMDPQLGWFVAGGPEGLAVLGQVDGTGTWQTLSLDGAAVVQCAASPSGTWCAAVTQDCGLWIWDRGTGRAERITRLPGEFTVKAVSPTSDWLLVAGHGGDHVELVDRRDGVCLSVIDGSLGWGRAVEVSARGDKLVTIQDQSRVAAVWDVRDPRSPRLIGTHSPHDDQVTVARLSHRGDLLLIGYQGGQSYIVDLAGETSPVLLDGDTRPTVIGLFGPDDDWVITGHFLKPELRVFEGFVVPPAQDAADVATQSLLRELSPYPLQAARGLLLMDPSTWDGARSIAGENPAIRGQITGRHADFLVTAGQLTLNWDLTSGTANYVASNDHDALVVFEPAGSAARAASMFAQAINPTTDDRMDEVVVWSLADGRSLDRFSVPSDGVTRGKVVSVGVASGKTWVAIATDGKSLVFWEASSGRYLHTVSPLAASSETVAVTPDGSHLLVGDEAGDLHVIDAIGGDLRRIRVVEGVGIRSVRLAGRESVAVGDGAGCLHLLDLEGQVVTATFPLGNGSIVVTDVADDGTLLMTRREHELPAGWIREMALVHREHGAVARWQADGHWSGALSADGILVARIVPHVIGPARLEVYRASTRELIAELSVEGAISQCGWIGTSHDLCLVGARGIYLLTVRAPEEVRLVSLPQADRPSGLASPRILAETATVVSGMNNREKAPYYALLAVHVAESSEDPAVIAEACLAAGDCFRRGGQDAEAESYFRRAAATAPHGSHCSITASLRLSAVADGAGRAAEAREFAQVALDASRQASRTQLTGISTRALARAKHALGDVDGATELLWRSAQEMRGEQALQQAAACCRLRIEFLRDHAPRGTAVSVEQVSQLADDYIRLGNYKEVRWALDLAAEISSQHGEMVAAAAFLVRCHSFETDIDVFEQERRIPSPRRLADLLKTSAPRVLAAARASWDEAALSTLLKAYAAMASELGRDATAVATRREILTLDERQSDLLVKAEDLAELGYALQQAAQHAEAVIALRGAHDGYLEHGQPWSAGWAARRLAVSYQELAQGGDAAAALEDGAKAYELAREWNGEQLGHTLMELARQYEALGRYADEITALARATSVWARGLDHRLLRHMGTMEEEYQANLLDALGLRAAAEEANGSGANAEQILRGIDEGLGSGRFGNLDKVLNWWTQNNIDLVNFYVRASRHEDAVRYSELALARLDQTENSENRRFLLWQDGWNRSQLNDYAGAAPPLREACQLYLAANETQDAIKVHQLLASVLHAGRRNREAAQVYRTIETLYEGLAEPIEAARARGAAIGLRMRGKVRRERDF